MITRRELLRHGSLWLAASAVALYGLDEAADRATWRRRLFPGFTEPTAENDTMYITGDYLTDMLSRGDWVVVVPSRDTELPQVARRIIAVSPTAITIEESRYVPPSSSFLIDKRIGRALRL